MQIFLAEILRLNNKSLAVREIKSELWHLWSTKNIASAHWVNRIESHCREHVPSRHLSTIVISAESICTREILCVEDFANQFLCALRLSSQSIEISHMMRRFIAVSILTNKTSHIRKSTFEFCAEEHIQLIHERLVSTHQLDEPWHIVLHMPSILPCISLCVVATRTLSVSQTSWVERRFPRAVSKARTHEFRLWVKQILVEILTLAKVGCIFLLTHESCHIPSSIIVVNGFKC